MSAYIVMGLGRFGSEVALRLCDQGCEVLAMDTNPDLVQHVADRVTHAVVADATDKAVLKALDASSFDCAIVAIGNSLAASVLVTMNLQELGLPKIICKASDETHRKVLLKMGAHQVVIPEKEHAARLARSLANPNVLDYIELSDACGIVEAPAPIKWRDKSLKELDIRARFGINIIAIKHDGEINTFPSADYRFAMGDVIVVMGGPDTVEKLRNL